MGCFNTSGFLSKLPICHGDRVVCFLGKINRNANVYGFCPTYPFSVISPKCLPVYGEYDDYGSVEYIDESPVTKFLEDISGTSCEQLFDAVSRTGYRKIKYGLEHWGYFKKDEVEKNKYKEDWEIFLPLLKIYDVEDYPILLFEHEEIYNKFCEGESTFCYNWDEKTRFANFYNNLDVFINFLNEYKDKEVYEYLKDIKISLCDFDNSFINDLRWAALDYKYLYKNKGGEIDNEFLDKIDKISRENKLIPLISRSEGSESFELLNNIDINTAEDIFISCKEDVRKVCRLYEKLLTMPMYLTMSQTAGHQWYDLKEFDKFLTICKDFNNKKIEEESEE